MHQISISIGLHVYHLTLMVAILIRAKMSRIFFEIDATMVNIVVGIYTRVLYPCMTFLMTSFDEM